MSDESTVITPAAEPEFSLENYRAERDGKPADPAKEPSAELEAAPEPGPESDTGEKEQEQPEGNAKGKGGFQRRIDKLVREKADLERQLAERSAAQPAKSDEAAPAPAGEPKLESFDSYDAYVAALTDWKVEQKFQAREQAEAKAKADAEAAAKVQTLQQKAEAARAKHDDFDDVVGDASITAVMRDFLMESEHPGELMYALGSDRAELARISGLSPVAQIRALTALEAKLAPTPEAPKPRATRAPEPIRPVGTAAAPITTFRDGMSFEEYKQWRQSGGGR